MYQFTKAWSRQTKFAGMALSDVRVWRVEPFARIYQGRARLADHELR